MVMIRRRKLFDLACLIATVWLCALFYSKHQLRLPSDDEAIAAVIPRIQIGPKIDPNTPGEMGKAVHIVKEELSEEEKKRFDLGWTNNAFNEYASNIISVHRSLPDVRHEACLTIPIRKYLPSSSIILCFYNEAWSVLLRSVHSILNRSPPHLVKEIILVDDFSTRDNLKAPLDEYMKKLGKVRIVRAKRREGLIRARLLGASAAQGDILTFLDSHIECFDGWLEPLLNQVAANWSNVVTPVIETIRDDDFKVTGTRNPDMVNVGGFDWNLQFTWHIPPSSIRDNRKTQVDPIPSPTMAGGLFSINRKYFEYLGAYDPGFDIWGAENLELSFKIWMCGGQLHTMPCSHVGHIFRKYSPYSWGTVNVLQKNSIRLAEVWMDNYKKYYYLTKGINKNAINYGDISSRKALRRRLRCKSFQWYIENIYPEIFMPQKCIAYGEIRSADSDYCIDAYSSQEKPVILRKCHNQSQSQYWMLTKRGEIRTFEYCLDFPGGESIVTYPCHNSQGNQHFEYREDGTIFQVAHKLCLEGDGLKLSMKDCSGILRQKWLFKRGSPLLNMDAETKG